MNYDFQAGSTVQYSSPSGIMPVQSTGLTYSNLSITGGATSTINSTLTVTRNLTISSPGILDCSGQNIWVGGDWNNYDEAGFNEGSTATVYFNGTAAQGIYCGGTEKFNNVVISNASASGVQLNADVAIGNDLDLGTNGRLFFGPTPNTLALTNMTPGSSNFKGSSNALVDLSGSASTFYIGCQNPTYNGLINAGTTSLINFNRDSTKPGAVSGSQNILTGYTYANLSVSGTNSKSFGGPLAVAGTYTVDGATTSMEVPNPATVLTLGGDLILSGGGSMGGASGATCLYNLVITTSGNATQTFNAGFDTIRCNNLISNKTVGGITLNNTNTTLTVANNITQQNAALLSPNNNRIRIGNLWTIPAATNFAFGTSTVEYMGAVNQPVAPVNYYNFESTSSGTRVFQSGAITGIANIFTPGTNAYTFTGSTVDYNGPASQTIAPFTSGLTPGSTYNNLTLSNTGTKSLTGNTDLEGSLTLNNNITLALGNQYLNLRSTVTQTARVAPVSSTASITYGTGRFVVERYFPGKRSWRLVTAPVTADAGRSFFNSWQVGGNFSLAGSGTYITGPNPSAANGLDVSPLNNSSLKIHNRTTGQFDPVLNTKTALLSGTAGASGSPDNVGYFLFVRGDRTSANSNAFNAYGSINQTTLRDTGKIQTGSYTFSCNANAVAPNNFSLIGNPYASPIDFASLTRNGVANKFWAWDPNLNTSGGYVIVDMTAGPSITTVPAGGSTTQNQYIQSSQAFMVQTTGASPTISFGESAKSSQNNLNLFRPQNNPTYSSLALNLYFQNTDGSTKLADGLLNQFSDRFSNETDELDGLRLTNVNETFGVLNGSNNLMLNRRKPPVAGDTLFMRTVRFNKPAYTLKIDASKLAAENLAGYWEDNYLKSSTPFSMEGETSIDFNTNSDAATRAADRFRIVFRKLVDFTGIKAQLVEKDVLVQWTVTGDLDVARYEIERSVDGGNTFSATGTVASTHTDRNQAASYAYSDLAPTPGIYHYRIKAVSSRGVVACTEMVRVVVMSTAGNLYVFPNPVKAGQMNLQMNTVPAGNYFLRLISSNGQLLFSNRFIHDGNRGMRSFSLPSSVIPGSYTLELACDGLKQKWVLPGIVVGE
jgi:hypothetical protein